MMGSRVLYLAASLGLVVLGAAVPVSAAQFDITFDTVPGGLQCGESWQEGVFALNFAFMTEEDYHVGDNYYCNFAVNPGSLELDGVRLYVNMWAVAGITTVEVDIEEHWSTGATRVFLYTDGLATLVDSALSGDPDRDPDGYGRRRGLLRARGLRVRRRSRRDPHLGHHSRPAAAHDLGWRQSSLLSHHARRRAGDRTSRR